MIAFQRELYIKTQHSGSIHITLTHTITVNVWGSSSVIEQILMYYPLALHLKMIVNRRIHILLTHNINERMMLYFNIPPMCPLTDNATNKMLK